MFTKEGQGFILILVIFLQIIILYTLGSIQNKQATLDKDHNKVSEVLFLESFTIREHGKNIGFLQREFLETQNVATQTALKFNIFLRLIESENNGFSEELPEE